VVEEMQAWQQRPLDEVYAAIFVDAIVVKVRDGQVANRPVYAAIGVTLGGEKDILGLWAGTGGEGAKFWMAVLTDIRNRGVRDVFFVVCDGLKGLPEVVGNVWPLTIVQTCIIHLIRNTFRLASKRDWDALKRDVRPIYTAVNAAAARAALDELTGAWGSKYGAIIRLWENAWEQFIPFLDYDLEIRTVLCSTDEIVKPSLGFLLVSGVASGRRELRRRVRRVRRPRSPRPAAACCYRPRRASGSCRAATGRPRRARACAACG
jgi:putative transposase